MQKKRVPYGSDVSAGTYRCADCGYELSSASTSSLPPCPRHDDTTHTNEGWNIVSGVGDAVEDPRASRV